MTRPSPRALLVPLLLFLMGPEVLLARRLDNPCLTMCTCVGSAVTCRRTKMVAIPNSFPEITNRLIIMDQPIVDKTLRKHNISYLTNLEELYINKCGLKNLEVGVFSGLLKLRHVDLSNNRLHEIYANTFRGLNLKFLFLGENPDIQLQQGAFNGLRAGGLSLKKCGLRSIAYETFRALNSSIKSLFLNGNELSDLDPRFELIFGHLETLAVMGNPFMCKCSLRWLVRYLRRQALKPSTSAELGPNPSTEEQPKCALPKEMLGMELRSIIPSQLRCDPPRLGNADVIMRSAETASLHCQASGYPRPTVMWRRIMPALRPGAPGLPGSPIVIEPRDSLPGVGNPLRPVPAKMNIKRKLSHDTYECVARNIGGNATLTVKVQWPPKLLLPPPPVRPNAGGRPPKAPIGPSQVPKNRRNGPNVFDDDPRFNYQFTLLELIGAVVGTFTATLALFLLICRCITYAKKKQKKQQWSTYESAYSGSHVYDVPRNEQGYMPKPADRHEFLDFKTGRKVYDHV